MWPIATSRSTLALLRIAGSRSAVSQPAHLGGMRKGRHRHDICAFFFSGVRLLERSFLPVISRMCVVRTSRLIVREAPRRMTGLFRNLPLRL